MQFRSYDALKTFDVVAQHLSMTMAADILNQSKGSISYQINKLENELGLELFIRANARLILTDAGRRLWHVSQNALGQIDREINNLKSSPAHSITIGALTYFSSRWLSPRLIRFFETNPGISLRIEPINSIDALKNTEVDLAVIWGFDDWPKYSNERLIHLPALPTTNRKVSEKIKEIGLCQAMKTIPLLGDSSGDAGWRAWHEASGLSYEPSPSSLTIPDSNSRVQAVIDGQGVALWDDLVLPEIEAGKLVRVSNVSLSSAGYYLVENSKPLTSAALAFLNWLKSELSYSPTT